jgi:tRNA-splicing endonuclease subunit Sen2
MSIQASVPPPGGFQAKGGFRQRAEKERRYGTPLPLLLPDSPLHVGYRPAASASSSSSSSSSSFKPNSNYTCPQSSLLAAYRGIISPAAAVAVPNCHGTLDRASQSVWVEGEAMETLFNRGFFGKGTLSRSDPNWRSRRVELLKGGSGESLLRRCRMGALALSLALVRTVP